ncbi:MAG TPA: OB-fold domain-containing protein [Acidimicrobiales bacterium]|nr:OB-fold domain-containing protein [Acidimicrobiales bacterium]
MTTARPEPRPPLPAPDPLTSFFWEAARRRRLAILRCDDCGWYVHWPRPVCKRCRSFSLTPTEVSGRGTLYSWTVGMQAFHPWFEDRLPYLLAVVELEEQANLKLVTNLVECDESQVEIGMALEVTFEVVSPELTLPMFRPAQGA